MIKRKKEGHSMSLKTKVLLSRIEKTFNLLSEKLRKKGIVRGKIVTDNIKMPVLRLFYSEYRPVLYVGDDKEFSSIRKAVRKSNDTPKYPVEIKIFPGVYKESIKLRGGRYITLSGEDKKGCILRDDSGDYWNPPLELAGQSRVFNMTIIATNEENKTNILPSYAIHHDFDGEGVSVISNCDLISHQHAAIGIGLRNNQTLKIENSNLYSAVESTLFIHNRVKNDAENQKLIVKDSVIESTTGSPVWIQDSNHSLGGGFGDKKDTELTFQNNTFKSKGLKESEFLGKIEPPLEAGCITGYIKLSLDSKGNNIEAFNAK